MTYDMVEGTTDTFQFQLLENGVPIDLSSVAITVQMENKDGTAVSSPGSITVIDASNGRVQFTPTNSSVLVASSGPYFVRWVLTALAGGAQSFVPTTSRDMWAIHGV